MYNFCGTTQQHKIHAHIRDVLIKVSVHFTGWVIPGFCAKYQEDRMLTLLHHKGEKHRAKLRNPSIVLSIPFWSFTLSFSVLLAHVHLRRHTDEEEEKPRRTFFFFFFQCIGLFYLKGSQRFPLLHLTLEKGKKGRAKLRNLSIFYPFLEFYFILFPYTILLLERHSKTAHNLPPPPFIKLFFVTLSFPISLESLGGEEFRDN